jgi:hypothetical protein
MDILIAAVKKLEERVHNTGCEDGNIVLSVNPDAVPCQFENGALMEASFGGRKAQFVTSDPIRATTRIGFMFGAPLDKPAQRGAAGAIINVITGFLCIFPDPEVLRNGMPRRLSFQTFRRDQRKKCLSLWGQCKVCT